MNKGDKAVQMFNNGFNCAQSVLTAFSGQFNLSEEQLLKISCGFGAGMGGTQGTCGAVTGAYMALGLKYGKYMKEDDPAKEKTYSLIKVFNEEFKKRYHTLSCLELLNCDFSTEKGNKAFKENNLKKSICDNCVRSAVEITESLLV